MNNQEELTQEVFACFGLAYYHSEVLHRSLCNIYTLASFNKAEDITGPRIDEKYVISSSLTLGQLVEKTKGLLPSELHCKLQVASDKRNYLAHRYWFERCHLGFNEEGLLELRKELTELVQLFDGLDQTISRSYEQLRRSVGISDSLVQECLRDIIMGKSDDLQVAQRLPKKREHVVKAWDVDLGVNLKAQIFETEDGSLWQFCDVGLGWTRFTKPSVDWTINEDLQKYLPVELDPRPTISEPWNYQIHLAKGAILWVKRGKKLGSYSWGLKVGSSS